MKSRYIFFSILFLLLNFRCYSTSYYWRAIGNWSDATSWSTDVSLMVTPSTQPGSGDDVILDSSSPTGTLTVSSGATCNNFISTGCTGTLDIANALTINGTSVTFSTTLNIVGTASITYTTVSNITIETGTAAKTFGDFIFTGVGPDYVGHSIVLNTNDTGNKTFGNFTKENNTNLFVNGNSTKVFGNVNLGNGAWTWQMNNSFAGPTTVNGDFSLGLFSVLNVSGQTTYNGITTFGDATMWFYYSNVDYIGAVTFYGNWFGLYTSYAHFHSTLSHPWPWTGVTINFVNMCRFDGDVNWGYNSAISEWTNGTIPVYNSNVTLGSNTEFYSNAGFDFSGAPSNTRLFIGSNSHVLSSPWNQSLGSIAEASNYNNTNNYFQNVTLDPSASLLLNNGTGTNTIRDLKLSRGSLVQLNHLGPNIISGTIYTTATSEITTPPDCGGRAWITTKGTSATMTLTTSPQTLEYAMFENITASGDGLVVNNGVDIGGNSNISFSPTTSKTYYWTGGTLGNGSSDQEFSNPLNWSETLDGSGDQIIGGSGCVPTPIDDVVFNARSFSDGSKKVVGLNGSWTSTCRDVIFTGAIPPGVTWGSGAENGRNDIYIYGNVTWHTNVSSNNMGLTCFRARSRGKVITTNTVGGTIPFIGNVEFAGDSGGWELINANLALVGNSDHSHFSINRGEFKANDNTISLYGNWNISTQPTAKFIAGTSTVIFNNPTNTLQKIQIYKNNAGTFEFYNLNIDRAPNTESTVQLGHDYYEAPEVQGPQYCTVKNVFTLNGGCFDLYQNRLIITNPLTTAIIRNNGYAKSEDRNNKSRITWYMGTTTGQHIYPFGKTKDIYLPFTFDLSNGNIDSVTVATYPTLTWNNNAVRPVWPTNVPDMKGDSSMVASYNDVSHYAIDRFWQIDKSGVSGKASLTFTYSQDEVTDSVVGNENHLMAMHYETKWKYGGPGKWASYPDDVANTVRVDDVESFSPWGLVGRGSNTPPGEDPLPVNFLSIEAKETKRGIVDINWKTAKEVNCDYYQVERSSDGKNFRSIGSNLKADHRDNYTVQDDTPFAGGNYYRVKMVESGGNEFYSPIRQITIKEEQAFFNVFPNPATRDNFNVSLKEGTLSEEVLVVLYNSLGQEVYSKLLINDHGNMLTAISLGDEIIPGVYLVVGTTNNSIYKKKVIIK